ncbi:carboxypeptidase S1 homolog A, partial [Striga asiatica]
MALGHKCDGDTWKPQVLHAVVTYLNAKLHLNLTKDNIKNRLKSWKKHFNVVYDIQTNQSGFCWDEDRKMIVVTSDESSSWAAYVEKIQQRRWVCMAGDSLNITIAIKKLSKGFRLLVKENWDDLVLLCGRDRATGQNVETFQEGSEAMDEDVGQDLAPSSDFIARARTSSSADSNLEKKTKFKKDSLAEVVGVIATSFQEYLARKKQEEKQVALRYMRLYRLYREEVFKAIHKLMNGDLEEFKLLKALPEEKKTR